MSKLRRVGWGAMAVLFTLGLVVPSVLSLLSNNQSSNPPASTPTLSCTFDPTISAPKLPKPAVYKPETKITQLITSDLVIGTGKAAKAGDCVTVKYFGSLTNGKVFDQDFTDATGLQFPLGQGEVIPGWDSGVVGMKVGGVRRLLIPSSLAYGDQAQGSIPANSPLVFEVKLLAIK